MRSESRPLHLFSKEKLDEFREMTLEARLGWLEEANAFITLVHGLDKRGEWDERFRDLPTER
jgi:hypothetical protein